MVDTAILLSLYAAMVAAYFRAPDRWARGTGPSSHMARWIDPAIVVLVGWALLLALDAHGLAAGLGLWCGAMMVAGVAAVSLAAVRPLAARRSGIVAVAAATLLPLAGMGGR